MNNNKTKFIFMTGGVLSGLGKGVSAASVGRLLKDRGYKIFVQKFDPYYNTDPGTMSPYQHGEVYVTTDGGETDLDLGHYERFIGETFTKGSNYTQGKILWEILNEERNGKFKGKTVQVIPHVTNKIMQKIEEGASNSQADFVITELGGTVGDFESLPFVYAISHFARKNKGNCFFMHATFLPYLEASSEFKSKPIQASLTNLKQLGIFPDMMLVRANRHIPSFFIKKIANKTLMDEQMCIPVPNVSSIYEIPKYFEKFDIAEKILNSFGMMSEKVIDEGWDKFVSLISEPKQKMIQIALIGKYVEFPDAYMSIVEALKISAIWNNVSIKMNWIQSDDIDAKNIEEKIIGNDGVIILPGFGKRGFDGKVIAAEYTRKKDIPTFGICYGFQAMVVHQAKLQGIEDATSSEVDELGSFVIDIIRGKTKEEKIGGTLRLGLSETKLKDGTLAHKLYNSSSAYERHRHRFEVNPGYIKKIENEEFVFSGFDLEKGYAEVCEMPNKKFYLGLQAHPEFEAKPNKEHPLFRGFIQAIIKHQK